MVLKIVPIKGTHAYTIITLYDITKGDPITVSYTKGGYYQGNCGCASCNPQNPPTRIKELEISTSSLVEKKPSKRAGKRITKSRQKARQALQAQLARDRTE